MSLHSPNHISNEGIQLPTDAFVVIVTTEWNKNIINELESGCIKILEENKIAYHSITVPGAVEIPFAIKHFWENTINKKPHAFISLGCVIRGGTPHFDFVCTGAMNGIMDVGLKFNKPCIFGVITTNTEQQAFDRAGGSLGNKGNEAAQTALQLLSISK
jgi:6,7-dimethyl-8-ribityllumazine synthase